MRRCPINRSMFYVRPIGLCTHVKLRYTITREYSWGREFNVDNTYKCPMYCMNMYVLAYMHVDKSFMHDIHRCGRWAFTGRTVVYYMGGSIQCLTYIDRICRECGR